MQTFVFDKRALQKLKIDLIKNPEKYEAMLQAELKGYDEEWDRSHDQHFTTKYYTNRDQNRAWWYKLYNDGIWPSHDNWPMQQEFYRYKLWADGIKSKSLGSLKYTVNKLLLEFEEKEKPL